MFAKALLPGFFRRSSDGYVKLSAHEHDDRTHDEVELRLCCLPFGSIIRRQPVDPQAACRRALYRAVKGSQACQKGSYDLQSLANWEEAIAKCQAAKIPFRCAVDTPLADGNTPLKALASSFDHAALYFVHSQLPAGVYSKGVFLGEAGDAKPTASALDWPGEQMLRSKFCLSGAPFTYRGEIGMGDISGYGVLTRSDGVTYVGRWRSETAYGWQNIRYTTRLLTQGDKDVHFTYEGPWSSDFVILERPLMPGLADSAGSAGSAASCFGYASKRCIPQ